MFKQSVKEAGYTTMGVVVSLGLVGGFAGLVSKQARQMNKITKPITYQSTLMDIRHYIHENFDCTETMKQNKSCENGSKFVDTYAKSGQLLTDKKGSNFADVDIKAGCYHGEFNFTYKNTEGDWEHLFDSLPKVCCDEADSGGACNGDDFLSFEGLPDGSSLVEGMAISDQFQSSHGVTFSRKNGDPLYVGAVEGDHYSWGCQTCGPSTVTNGVIEDPDQPVGKFFLTDEDGYSSGGDGDLVIDYSSPVKEASGVIMDIDWDEEWEIKAYSSKGELIHSQTIKGFEYDYDGKPMLWKIEGLKKGDKIKQIVLEGADNSGFGLGFDNFSPSKVCEEVTL